MIADTLEHLRHYGIPVEGLEEAMAWMQEKAPSRLEPGRYFLGETGAVAILASGLTVPAETEDWEAHRRFADLQVVLSGEEVMGFAPLSEMTPKGEYSAEEDCILLEGTGNFMLVRAGGFAFFSPHDAHKAMLSTSRGPAPVRKVVFKLPWKG
ncbi:MAG: YhcH/YjgK/YiaL family protein [Synergistales bacterium]|jgi:YhcH/YjgK/YiaL family protein